MVVMRNLFLLTSLLGLSSVKQEMEIPIDVQFAMFTKILKFDRNLQTRSEGQIVMGIFYEQSYDESVFAMEQIGRILPQIKEIERIPVSFVLVNATASGEWDTYLSEHDVDILYICPLRTTSVEQIGLITQKRRIVTMTGVSSYVLRGVSIGAVLNDRKPRPMINRRQAKAEGMDLDSKLLDLSVVVE